MRKFFILLGLCIINLNLYAQDDAINYIKQNAVAITADADSGYQDLLPLKTVLANRRVIGMGEATHGTHEFEAIKVRMLRFLVEQLGYKLFGIEANFTECRKVNDYVLYGKGDAYAAIGGTYFWTWKTTDVIQMVEWMHRYNIHKPDSAKVKFYGFDMQFDRGALVSIAEKLKKLDNDYYSTHFKALDSLKICDVSKLGYVKFSNEKVDSIKKLLTDIKIYTETQNGNLLKLFSADDIAYLKHDVRLLEQCLELDMEITKASRFTMYASRIRDKSMAENIEWILNYEGPASKMMIWAHNQHISKINYCMGSYLKGAYKYQYYAIGFDFNKGSFRAVDFGTSHKGLTTFTVNDAENGSSGNIFSQLNIPAFFIDMEAAVKSRSAAKSLFTKDIRQRSIGAAFNTQGEMRYYLKEPLYDDYDGLIFINNTTPTVWMSINKN